jgi:hypothetical protein
MHIVFTPSLFLISQFSCCSLSRYEKVPQERYKVTFKPRKTVRKRDTLVEYQIVNLRMWVKNVLSGCVTFEKKKYDACKSVGKFVMYGKIIDRNDGT